MSYESPIKLITDRIRFEQEDAIFTAVQRCGVEVDKDELIKALQYDRDQYQKGYNDGYIKTSEVAIEVIEEIERQIAGLEYRANTHRKTVRVEELKAQVNWVLHEVVPQTLTELKKKYKEVSK